MPGPGPTRPSCPGIWATPCTRSGPGTRSSPWPGATAAAGGHTPGQPRPGAPEAPARPGAGDTLFLPRGAHGHQLLLCPGGLLRPGLAARYPFISTGEIGRSVMGRPLWPPGSGGRTQPGFLQRLPPRQRVDMHPPAAEIRRGALRRLRLRRAHILPQRRGDTGLRLHYIAPAVNPDGMDLPPESCRAGSITGRPWASPPTTPPIPSPGLEGQHPGSGPESPIPRRLGTGQGYQIRQGTVSPAPADFVGSAPLSAPEARAMYDFTLAPGPGPHSGLPHPGQGHILEIPGPGAAGGQGYRRDLRRRLRLHRRGHPLCLRLRRLQGLVHPGFPPPRYTIEAGQGLNPLPLSQFDSIYRDNLGILTMASLVT